MEVNVNGIFFVFVNVNYYICIYLAVARQIGICSDNAKPTTEIRPFDDYKKKSTCHIHNNMVFRFWVGVVVAVFRPNVRV